MVGALFPAAVSPARDALEAAQRAFAGNPSDPALSAAVRQARARLDAALSGEVGPCS